MASRAENPSVALSEGQSEVVSHREGALLVTGVAGSGRTEALARRLAVLALSLIHI